MTRRGVLSCVFPLIIFSVTRRANDSVSRLMCTTTACAYDYSLFPSWLSVRLSVYKTVLYILCSSTEPIPLPYFLAVFPTMRVQLIGHFKTCMTDIYLHILCAHIQLYPHAPVSLTPVLSQNSSRACILPSLLRYFTYGVLVSGACCC